LPDLYIKVREKLLAYETERNPDVRDIISELGELGTRTKSLSELCEVDTCYFLLLGQSLTGKILPTKKSEMVIESPVS
jgi:CRISPR-associated protein Csh1